MKNFIRHNRKIQLQGIIVNRWEDLIDSLKEKNYPTDLLIADVILGAWKNQHVATELAQQIGCILDVKPYQGNSKSTVAANPYSYGNIAGRGIDAEAIGDRNYISAIEIIKNISGNLLGQTPKTILIFLPHEGYHLGRENMLFVYLLAQFLETTTHQLLLVSSDGTPAYEETPRWHVSYTITQPATSFTYNYTTGLEYVPGIIDSKMLKPDVEFSSQSVVSLANDCFFLKPEYRPATIPRFTGQDSFSKILVGFPPYLSAFYQYYGQYSYTLIPYAWQSYAMGNVDLALLLLEKCRKEADSIHQKAEITIQIQGLRIADMRFQEVANEPAPTSLLPKATQSFLFQAIGWGQAMTGKLDEAEQNFILSQNLQDEKIGPIEKCYFNNIYAFSQFRKGNLEKAFALEKEIESIHATVPEEDFRLTYINSINQARLYKKVKDYENSSFYYEKSFSTTLGNRSESDLIYTNVCRAMLYQDKNEIEKSFQSWLRASLYWVSIQYPEAVGWRTLSGITNKRLDANQDVIESTSGALLEHLLKHYEVLFQEKLPNSQKNTTFLLKSQINIPLDSCFGDGNVSVFTSQSLITPNVQGENYDALKAFLSGFLEKYLGILEKTAMVTIWQPT
jgi:tetratricopeptide (TPR) repeat protein